jgi:hypothetical protein
MFAKELTQAGHTRRFTVSEAGVVGWEIRIEQDSRVVQQVCYTDWHRVERAMKSLSQQIDDLEREGWQATQPV